MVAYLNYIRKAESFQTNPAFFADKDRVVARPAQLPPVREPNQKGFRPGVRQPGANHPTPAAARPDRHAERHLFNRQFPKDGQYRRPGDEAIGAAADALLDFIFGFDVDTSGTSFVAGSREIGEEFGIRGEHQVVARVRVECLPQFPPHDRTVGCQFVFP